jgi:hypothetical protein
MMVDTSKLTKPTNRKGAPPAPADTNANLQQPPAARRYRYSSRSRRSSGGSFAPMRQNGISNSVTSFAWSGHITASTMDSMRALQHACMPACLLLSYASALPCTISVTETVGYGIGGKPCLEGYLENEVFCDSVLLSPTTTHELYRGAVTHALHNGRYPKSRRRQRRAVAQRLGASAANGQLRVCMAGLCYDTQHVEAMRFPVAMPDKTPWALS